MSLYLRRCDEQVNRKEANRRIFDCLPIWFLFDRTFGFQVDSFCDCTFRTLMKRVGRQVDQLQLIRQAALALEFIHAVGIVHNDLKLSSFCLFRHGDLVTVKLTGFGSAKFLGYHVDRSQWKNDNEKSRPPELFPATLRESKQDLRELKTSADAWRFGYCMLRCMTSSDVTWKRAHISDRRFRKFVLDHNKTRKKHGLDRADKESFLNVSKPDDPDSFRLSSLLFNLIRVKPELRVTMTQVVEYIRLELDLSLIRHVGLNLGRDTLSLLRSSKMYSKDTPRLLCRCRDPGCTGHSMQLTDPTPQDSNIIDELKGDEVADDAPDIDAPVFDAQAGHAPDGDAPDGDSPDGDAPDGDAPDGDSPDGDAPDGDAPDGDSPDGDAPDGDAPGGDAPGGDDPDFAGLDFYDLECVDLEWDDELETAETNSKSSNKSSNKSSSSVSDTLELDAAAMAQVKSQGLSFKAADIYTTVAGSRDVLPLDRHPGEQGAGSRRQSAPRIGAHDDKGVRSGRLTKRLSLPTIRRSSQTSVADAAPVRAAHNATSLPSVRGRSRTGSVPDNVTYHRSIAQARSQPTVKADQPAPLSSRDSAGKPTSHATTSGQPTESHGTAAQARPSGAAAHVKSRPAKAVRGKLTPSRSVESDV
eukprot:scpid54786/ scgid4184/ 